MKGHKVWGVIMISVALIMEISYMTECKSMGMISWGIYGGCMLLFGTGIIIYREEG